VPAPLRSALVRRLFSLAGVAPLGLFLVLHLAVNATALGGHRAFERVADALGRVPGLPLLEAALVFAPLALHGAIGLWLIATRTPLASPSPYPPAVRLAMRVTGAAALAFVAMHITEFRFRTPGARLNGSELGTLVAGDLSATWMGLPWRGVAYLAGTACVTFHFATGVWGLLAARPALAESAGKRKRVAWGVGAVGGALWIAFANVVVFQATGARLFGEPAEGDGVAEPCPAPDLHKP
jgi:succinate dehydrogenase / fumarate reductase cytochrome b subunit